MFCFNVAKLNVANWLSTTIILTIQNHFQCSVIYRKIISTRCIRFATPTRSRLVVSALSKGKPVSPEFRAKSPRIVVPYLTKASVTSPASLPPLLVHSTVPRPPTHSMRNFRAAFRRIIRSTTGDSAACLNSARRRSRAAMAADLRRTGILPIGERGCPCALSIIFSVCLISNGASLCLEILNTGPNKS